jgi:hypothetical protein
MAYPTVQALVRGHPYPPDPRLGAGVRPRPLVAAIPIADGDPVTVSVASSQRRTPLAFVSRCPRRVTPEEIASAIALYSSGLSIDAVACQLGRTYQTIRRVMADAGVKFRPPGYGAHTPEAAALCRLPRGKLPTGHHLQEVDRAMLRDRTLHHRLDLMRRSSGFPAALLLALLLAVGPALADDMHMHARAPADAPWYPLAKSPLGGSCCGNKDCRISAYCATDTVGDGIVVDGVCLPIPYDRLVPAPAGIVLGPDEVHVCAQRRAKGLVVICVLGGAGV